MTWQFFDSKGNRAPARLATFKAQEVLVASGVPAPVETASTSCYQYREVHAIDEPSVLKNFGSAREMKKWFAEHGRLKAKATRGSGRGNVTSRGGAS
jgi:hypothetical protein